MSHEHITTAQIEQDILDTEREIVQMRSEVDWLEGTPVSHVDYRWNQIRLSAKRSGIVEREEFIEKLKTILAARGSGDGH